MKIFGGQIKNVLLDFDWQVVLVGLSERQRFHCHCHGYIFSIGAAERLSIFMDIHRGMFCSIGAAKSFNYGTIVAGVFYGRELTLPPLLRQAFMEGVYSVLNPFQKIGLFWGPNHRYVQQLPCKEGHWLVTVCGPLLFECFFTHSF